MIELINNSASVWLNYFSMAILQNTIFLGLVFLAFYLFRNESAKVKYGIALIGLIKLLIPPFIPDSVLGLFRSNLNPQPTIRIGNIIPIGAPVSQPTELSLTSLLLCLWIVATIGYILLALTSTLILWYKLSKTKISSTEIRDNKAFLLCQTELTTIPLSVGVFPQKIFLPANWNNLSKECRQVLLEHEIAHLQRKDGIVQFLQIVVQAIYFFHPLVWMLNERLNEYREMACDDEAVNRAKLSPTKYSRYLVSLAEKVANPQWCHTSASALIKQKNKLLNRVNYQIKEKTMNQSKKKIFTFLTGLFILMLPLSLYLNDEIPALETTELTARPQAVGLTGKISGTVIDQKTKEPLPGANIILVGTKKGAAADAQGKFVIPDVPPGIYQLYASMMGYEQVLMDRIMIAVGKTTNLDFKLKTAVINAGKMPSQIPVPPLTGENGDSTVFLPYDKAPEPIGGMAAIQKKVIYPETSRKEGREGIVDLKILIDTQGNVAKAEMSRIRSFEFENKLSVRMMVTADSPNPKNEPDQAMIDAAIKAVKESKWKPAEQRGRPVQVWIAIPIGFSLK